MSNAESGQDRDTSVSEALIGALQPHAAVVHTVPMTMANNSHTMSR